MGDKTFIIFGSFTEEETRFFQNQSSINVAGTAGKTELQSGSLDVSSLTPSKGFGAKQEQKSENIQGTKLVAKVKSFKKEATVTKDSQEVSQTQINGTSNGSLSHNGLVFENGRNPCALSLLRIAEEEKIGDTESLTCKKMHDGYDKAGSSNSSIDSPEALASVKDVSQTSSKQEKLPKILMPRGLINSGNLCFLNATLQALLSCSPFACLLQELRNRDIPKVDYPTLHAFVEFISNFDMPNDLSSKASEMPALASGKPFSPNMFDHVLRKFTPDLQAGISGRPRQEDAQEFLSFVMDQMHDELLKLENPLFSQNEKCSSFVSSVEDDGWETVGPKNKSAVTRTQKFMPSQLSAIFGGQLRSVVKARGNKASATVQPYLLLHLDIHPESVHSIEDALHLFSAPEALEGYKTSAGKAAEVAASKSVKIQELSRIMILHLMRFSYGSKGMAKLHKPVCFPLELVLGRELLASPVSEGRKYELVATVTHHGREPSRGHYTSDTRFSHGQWLRYDDASVTAVSIDDVLHDQAYVLFYKQV
ncbi:putative ubiquitinyl hydrolase 1 [Dioscorea sansibarensis]